MISIVPIEQIGEVAADAHLAALIAVQRRQGAHVVVRPGLMLGIDRKDDLQIWRQLAIKPLSARARAGRQYRTVRRR